MLAKLPILAAALLFLAAPSCRSQDVPPPRYCIAGDLEPALHFYRTPDKGSVVALNYRNVSDSVCQIDSPAVHDGGVNIHPGQTVHTFFRSDRIEESANLQCQFFQFPAYHPGPTISFLTPTLTPVSCRSWAAHAYKAGPFVPDWPATKEEPAPLPQAPVLLAPKEIYNEREIIELRLHTDPTSAREGECPALFEFVRDESGGEFRELLSGMFRSPTGCKGYSAWSERAQGPREGYPIQVRPNGVRGADTPGKLIVSVYELGGMGADGELRLVSSNALTLSIVDPTTLERSWGKTKQGIRANLTLDKLSYQAGESIPLHLAFENASAGDGVYGRPLEQNRCRSSLIPDSPVDYTVKVEKEDGSTPHFLPRTRIDLGGPCGTVSPQRLEQGKIMAVEDTLADRMLLPRDPGVYRITVTWSGYHGNPGSSQELDSGTAASVSQTPFVTVTSAPLILTITPRESSASQ